jgi:hypothetical protein
MGMLLAFAPFIAFAVIDRLFGAASGLAAGTVVSAAVILRDYLSASRRAKLLEIGTVILFGGLSLFSLLSGVTWSVIGVRLCVDAGLLLIILLSLALQRPFTLQYAREQVAREYWNTPGFVRTNYVISGVWGLAFVVMVIADLVLLYAPGLPPRFGIIATILALVGAVKMTSWYPERVRARAG